MMGTRYDFDYTKISQAFDNLENVSFKYVQEIQTRIVKKEDEAIKAAIVRYMREHAEEYNKNITLFLIDEEEVEKIIDLGIDAYKKQKHVIE
jgi:DNA-directed RNA polymerase beta' subunit